MSITIKKYSSKDSLKWDDFVQKSNNGTIFHNRSFLNYHIDRSFKDSSIIFERGGNIVAVLSAAEVISCSEKIFYSHPGATFGGIVYNNLTFKDAKTIIDKLVDYCKGEGFSAIFLIQPPQLYNLRKNETLEYILNWYGFDNKETYFSSFIDLKSQKKKLLKRKGLIYINSFKANISCFGGPLRTMFFFNNNFFIELLKNVKKK